MKRRNLTAFLLATLAVTPAAPSSAQENVEQGSRRERSGRRERGGRDDSSAGARPQGAPQSQPSPGRTGRLEDDYKLLLERSIFARSGAARAAERPATTSTAPAVQPLSPEQTIVFIGVLAQDHEYAAFAENRQTNQLVILRTGDDVAKGKVVGITLDTLAYGVAGAIKEVHLGQNLAGEAVASYFAGGAATVAPGVPGGSPAAAPGGASSTTRTPEQQAVIERLRQRRQRGE